jgi:hypothetical protein
VSLARVDPDDGPFVVAFECGVAVDVRVGAQLLDQVDADRHAAVAGPDQVDGQFDADECTQNRPRVVAVDGMSLESLQASGLGHFRLTL